MECDRNKEGRTYARVRNSLEGWKNPTMEGNMEGKL
jgi:hypothetical protein